MSEARAQAYAEQFDQLTLANVEELRSLLHPEVHFKDPFNDVRGADKMIGLMRQMFEDTQAPRFTTSLILAQTDQALLKWHFTCSVRYFGALAFDGVSELRFDEQDRITAHIDYWDAGSEVYAKLPLLGRAVNFVRRRLTYRG